VSSIAKMIDEYALVLTEAVKKNQWDCRGRIDGTGYCVLHIAVQMRPSKV